MRPSALEPARAVQIEVFADIACPFAHVGLRRVVSERDERRSPVTLLVRAWPLEWVNGEPHDPAHIGQVIAALRASVAPTRFAGFDPDTFPTTTIAALGLVAAAYDASIAAGERMSLRLRDAVFEEGRPLDPRELRVLAREAGVEVPSFRRAEAAVRADYALGQERGVRGSPHFFAGPRDWLCPSLVIARSGTGLAISIDESTLDEFVATTLG